MNEKRGYCLGCGLDLVNGSCPRDCPAGVATEAADEWKDAVRSLCLRICGQEIVDRGRWIADIEKYVSDLRLIMQSNQERDTKRVQDMMQLCAEIREVCETTTELSAIGSVYQLRRQRDALMATLREVRATIQPPREFHMFGADAVERCRMATEKLALASSLIDTTSDATQRRCLMEWESDEPVEWRAKGLPTGWMVGVNRVRNDGIYYWRVFHERADKGTPRIEVTNIALSLNEAMRAASEAFDHVKQIAGAQDVVVVVADQDAPGATP